MSKNLMVSLLLGVGLSVFSSAFAASSKNNGNGGSNNGVPFDELQAQIDSLQTQIDALGAGQANYDPIQIAVDCINGDSVNGAIASAGNKPNPLLITVSGVCNETVFIARDDVTIQGDSQSDGISGQFAVAAQRGASRIQVSNMTLTGSFAALSCFSSASVFGTNLILENSARGVLAFYQGSCVVHDSVIRNNAQGMTIGDSGSVFLRGSIVENNNTGANVFANGSLTTDSTAVNPVTVIRGSIYQGVSVFDNGSYRPVNTVVENNNIGIQVFANSSMQVEHGNNQVTVQNNSQIGINVGSLGSVRLSPAVTVTGNGNVDVVCQSNSYVETSGATIGVSGGC